MRSLALSVAVLALMTTAAHAQSADCKSIASATDRLACYDKLSPPVQQAASAAKPSSTKSDDPTLNDETALKARINNICRGC